MKKIPVLVIPALIIAGLIYLKDRDKEAVEVTQPLALRQANEALKEIAQLLVQKETEELVVSLKGAGLDHFQKCHNGTQHNTDIGVLETNCDIDVLVAWPSGGESHVPFREYPRAILYIEGGKPKEFTVTMTAKIPGDQRELGKIVQMGNFGY